MNMTTTSSEAHTRLEVGGIRKHRSNYEPELRHSRSITHMPLSFREGYRHISWVTGMKGV